MPETTYLYTLFLYDTFDDLGVVYHPAPNLDADDEVTRDDGRRDRIHGWAPSQPEAPVQRILAPPLRSKMTETLHSNRGAGCTNARPESAPASGTSKT